MLKVRFLVTDYQNLLSNFGMIYPCSSQKLKKRQKKNILATQTLYCDENIIAESFF